MISRWMVVAPVIIGLSAGLAFGCGSDPEPEIRGPGGSGGTAGTGGTAGSGGTAGTGGSGGEGGTGGDPGVQCTPGTKRCVGDTAEVCVTAGNAWNQLACSNGCESGECKPLSLETGWVVHQYDLLDDTIKTPASYTFENNGLVAFQSRNPMASVYYNDTELPEGIRVTGRFGVRTTNDDDLIGFVFGWQDPEHYYLVDWKQNTQAAAPCGTATEGASLKLVDSDTTIDKCEDFWSSAGTSRVSPLLDVAQNPAGWKDNTEYDIELIFRPGDIKVTIKEADTAVVTITSSDSTYRSGKFGFFNYSQEGVRYEFFAISPVD